MSFELERGGGGGGGAGLRKGEEGSGGGEGGGGGRQVEELAPISPASWGLCKCARKERCR